MAKKAFSEIFTTNPSGSLTPKFKININGVTFGTGVTIGEGVTFGGVNLYSHRGEYIEVEIEGEVHIIKGFYTK